MARVHRVSKSVKVHICGRGGHEIPAGEPYSWAKPGFRTRTPLIRCNAHPFRPSELTTSMAAEPMAAQEDFEDALDSIDAGDENALDELSTALEEFAGVVREYADARQAALDAWEYGNSALEELAETAESAAGEIENHDVQEWDAPDAEDLDLEDGEDAEEKISELRREFVENQIEEARGVASGVEF